PSSNKGPMTAWHRCTNDGPISERLKPGKSALFVYGSTYGSPVPVLGALGLIVNGARRKKRKDGETAPEDLQETPPLVAGAEEPGDQVTSTVYAPGQARPGDSFLVQVFLHLAEQADGLAEWATMSDEDAKKRDSVRLGKKIT